MRTNHPFFALFSLIVVAHCLPVTSHAGESAAADAAQSKRAPAAEESAAEAAETAETPATLETDKKPESNAARIAWFGTWKSAEREAKRSGRPILLVAAAPFCHGVPGMW